MLFNLILKTTAVVLLIPVLLPALATADNSDSAESGSAKMDQVLVHLDVDKLSQSQTGNVLASSLQQIPYVSKQLNSIPKNLMFLTKAKCTSITLEVTGSEDQQTAVLEVVSELNNAKLYDLLSHANGYAKVQFNGVDIHHWVTDFESLGNQFMGQGESPWADNHPDAIYLASPASGRFLVSTSLAKLTKILSDPKRSPATKLAIFNQFGQTSDHLISFHVSVASDEIPGELFAVIGEEDSGRLRVQATLKSRSDSEKQIATMIASLLNDPGMATGMIAARNPEIAAAEKQTPGKRHSIELQADSDSEKLKHANKLSLGLQMDSATLEQGDWKGMIERFLTNCVRCQHREDTLTLDIEMFLGPCRVVNIPRDSEEGISQGLAYNVMQLFFNVYSTDKERQAAIKIAAKQTREQKKR